MIGASSQVKVTEPQKHRPVIGIGGPFTLLADLIPNSLLHQPTAATSKAEWQSARRPWSGQLVGCAPSPICDNGAPTPRRRRLNGCEVEPSSGRPGHRA